VIELKRHRDEFFVYQLAARPVSFHFVASSIIFPICCSESTSYRGKNPRTCPLRTVEQTMTSFQSKCTIIIPIPTAPPPPNIFKSTTTSKMTILTSNFPETSQLQTALRSKSTTTFPAPSQIPNLRKANPSTTTMTGITMISTTISALLTQTSGNVSRSIAPLPISPPLVGHFPTCLSAHNTL
jgi:hypothetical protein